MQIVMDSTMSDYKEHNIFDALTTTQQLCETSSLVISSKRSAWTRRLVITKQPASEFYKDEGGKANSLSVEVTLVEFDETGAPAKTPDYEFVNIPLRVWLYFESGKKVDESDQDIFRFVGNEYDSIVIKGDTRSAIIYFRLEKVSRRKDGQRFKLKIEADREQCTTNVDDLSPVFTNAICVLSKRKHHSYQVDNNVRFKELSNKICRRDFLRLEESLNDKVDMMKKELDNMGRLVHHQNQILSRFESFFKSASHASHGEVLPFDLVVKSDIEGGMRTHSHDLRESNLSYFGEGDENDGEEHHFDSISQSDLSFELPNGNMNFAEF